MAYNYEYFKNEIFAMTGIDLSAYKEKQMKRRIDAYISKYKLEGYRDFLLFIQSDAVKMNQFMDFLTINVTEFFRNPKQWEYLDSVLIPNLIERYGKNLMIWSCACSTGEEAYSIAMLLSNHLPLSSVRILATDIDENVLSFAREGVYSKKCIESLPKKYVNSFITKEEDSYFLSPEIKKCVTFRKLDLLTDPFPATCHLIICRNVFIYFTEDTKEKLYPKFYHSLVEDGYLFMGSTEQIMNYKDLGFEREKSFFYKKQK